MYVVVRTWANASALADTMQQRSGEVEELIGGVPGFVAYYATLAGDSVTTVTVCEDRAGAQESTKRAAEWVRNNLTDANLGTPQILEGETYMQF